MKRIFVLLITLSIALSACSTASNTSGETAFSKKEPVTSFSVLLPEYKPANENQENGDHIYDMAVDAKGNLYFAYNNVIQVLDNSGKKLKEITQNGKLGFCTGIAISGESLYVVDMGLNGRKRLKTFNLKGDFIKEYLIGKLPGQCAGIELQGEKLYLLCVSDNGIGNGKLFEYDMKENKLKELSFNNVSAFTVYKDNSLIIWQEADYERGIAVYDCEKGKVTDEYKKLNDYSQDVCYNPGNGYVYLASGSVIKKYMPGEDFTETVTNINNNAFNRIVFVNGIIIALDGYKKTVYKVDEKNLNQKSGKIINIISRSPIEGEVKQNKAIEIFTKKNPGMQVKFTNIDVSKYDDMLNKKLMAGDNDFDIFQLDCQELPGFLKNNAMLNLDGYPEVRNKFNEMFEGFLKNCTYKGRLFGVPLFSDVTAWAVNEELAKKLNMENPSPEWRWTDLYDYAKKARQDINGDGKPDTYLFAEGGKRFPAFLDQYVCAYMSLTEGKADFNNKEFISLIKLWKRLWDEDLILKSFEAKRGKTDNVLLYNQYLNLSSGNSKMLPTPMLENKKVYPVYLSYFCVNKTSRNIDAAVDYLSAYLSKEVQTQYPETGEALYKDLALYKQPEEWYEYGLSNKENYNLFMDVINNGVTRQHDAEIFIYIGDTLEKFFEGSITAEKAAEMINTKARIIVGE